MRRAMAAAGAALMLALITPRAEAAPYHPSCMSGVLAPQLCTFALSAVTTRVAQVGQYAVVAHVRTNRDERACRDGWVENYAARVEGGTSPNALGGISVTLWGCPGAHPSVRARFYSSWEDAYWQVETWIIASSDGVRLAYSDDRPASSPNSWDDSTEAEGTIFHRDTGVRGDLRGTHHWCDDLDRGGSHGCLSYADSDAAVTFDSSITGHWARFYSRFGDGAGYEDDKLSRESRSEPYGSGWKVTRIS